MDVLKQIYQNKLAFSVEKLLSVRQANKEAGTVTHILMADQPNLTQYNGMSYACV